MLSDVAKLVSLWKYVSTRNVYNVDEEEKIDCATYMSLWEFRWVMCESLSKI